MRTAAPWLGETTPRLILEICRRAVLDVGICELPPGSNRSGRIDEYNRLAGVAVGSYWCASAVRAWWSEGAAAAGVVQPLPPYPASCDSWMAWAHATGRWSQTPRPGFAVLYGKPTDAVHIGCIVRATPRVLSIEGNTQFGGEFDRNGWAIAMKLVNPTRVVGYVSPTPL